MNKEWIVARADKRDDRLTSRIASWPRDDRIAPPLQRQAWEGFVDVGFRTIALLD